MAVKTHSGAWTMYFAMLSACIVELFIVGIAAAPTTLAIDQQQQHGDSIPMIYTRRLASNADDGNIDLNDIPSYMIWLSLMGQQHRARAAQAVTTPSSAADEEEILNALNSAVVERQQQQQLHQREPIVMRREVRQGKSAWDVPRSGNNAIFPHIGRRSPEPQASAMSMLLQEMAEARQRQQAGGSGSSFGSSNMMIMPRIGRK